MIPLALAWLKPKLLAALPYLFFALAVGGVCLWINGLRETVDEQAAAIGKLQTDLAAEQLARRKDVAGLTALSSGLAQAATDTAKDQAILERTIDATNPKPASAGLASLIACLRDRDAGRECAPAGSTGR